MPAPCRYINARVDMPTYQRASTAAPPRTHAGTEERATRYAGATPYAPQFVRTAEQPERGQQACTQNRKNWWASYARLGGR